MRIPTPISAEQANEGGGGGFAPWRAGDYDFEVHAASEEISKSSGREQIKLTLYVFDEDGNKRTVFDYLGSDEKSQWKVRHCAEALGLVAQYERGEMDPFDLEGKSGRLRLRVKKAEGEYPANNTVGDYIPLGDQPAKAARPTPSAARPAALAARPPGGASPSPHGGSTSADLDDTIPFAPEWR